MFDDYSQNLHEWQAAGGTGIKCYNGINGNNGTWKGNGAIWSFQVREFLGLTEQKKSPYYHGQLLIDQSDINVKYCIQ